MGRLVGNSLSNMQASGAIAPAQEPSRTFGTIIQDFINESRNQQPSQAVQEPSRNFGAIIRDILNNPMNQGQQAPMQGAVTPQQIVQPLASMAGGQTQGLGNTSSFVQQIMAQLMAERAANQQAYMGQQTVQQQPLQSSLQQSMPFTMPVRSNYFFSPPPVESSFQSMQQQPLSGGFGGRQGLFGFNPYMNSRIY